MKFMIICGRINIPLKTEFAITSDIINTASLQRTSQVNKIIIASIIAGVLSLSAASYMVWAVFVPTKHTNSTISLGSVWKDVPKSITKHCSVFSEDIVENDIYIVRDCETALYTTVNDVVLAKALKKEDGTYN